jgi:hypothetical protein
MEYTNFLKYMPSDWGTPNEERVELGPEKSSVVASFCDEELDELPEFNLIPEGLILICVVENSSEIDGQEPYETAMICDTHFDWQRVKSAMPGDPRPQRFFLMKRDWVRQMARKPLESDQ